MFQLTTLTIQPNQLITTPLSDGSTAQLQFIYRPAIQRWSVDIAYGTFSAKGLILSTHPNLLRIWRNVIPFGLQVVTVDGTDPFRLDDFSTGRVVIYILDGTNDNTDLDDTEAEYFQ
jgi:hypothetical protein